MESYLLDSVKDGFPRQLHNIVASGPRGSTWLDERVLGVPQEVSDSILDHEVTTGKQT